MKSKRLSRKRRSKVSRKKVSRKRVSRKRRSNKRNLFLGTGLAAGLITAGLSAKNLKANYFEKVDYEEQILVPTEKEQPVKFADKVNFYVRDRGFTAENKIKYENKTNLYETIGVKVFRGKDARDKLLSIPKEFITKKINNKTFLPTYFIVNALLIPFQGEKYSVTIYYRIKQETIDVINKKTENKEIIPAIDLLRNFVTDNKNYRERFKCLITLINKSNENDFETIDSGSLDLGPLSKYVINMEKVKLNKKEGKGTILDKVVDFNKIKDIVEIDVDINKFDLPNFLPTMVKNKILREVPTYYDKTDDFRLDIGFVIEGGPSTSTKNKRKFMEDNDLPEVLLGGTKLYGFKIIAPKSDPEEFIVGNSEKLEQVSNLIDPKTKRMQEIYKGYIEHLCSRLNTTPMDIDLRIAYPEDDRSKSKEENKKIFLYARYFYYQNLKNKQFALQNNMIKYKTINNNYIAKGTCFGNDKIFNFYQVSQYSQWNWFSSTNTYRFGIAISNVIDIMKDKTENQEAGKDLVNLITSKINEIKKINLLQKKLICISLLTPCNTSVCKLIENGAKTLPKEAYFSFMENKIIDAENKAFNELGHIFLNIPLSSNKFGTLFKQGTKSIGSTDESHNQITKEFEDLIDMTSPQKIFKTIVDITILYSRKYSNYFDLCYHCKSGKDRTSVCDAIVQATLRVIRNGNETDYEVIRKLTQKLLIYGYIITFYSTGIPGIKLNNMPVAKYILGNEENSLYKFYLGNSRLSTS